ncbi:MAG: nucleotidyl transferase AbiEii/AbiGii toxin family protein [Clostridia bacterium]
MSEDYGIVDANAKVCQDIILSKISKSKFADNITIKGGVVMHNISNDSRRATRDIDLDFIKYSIEDNYIFQFIEKLNNVNDQIEIKIIGTIKPLSHQDYNGKRVHVELSDEFNNKIQAKLDIGVHKDFDVSQEEFYFDLNNIGESAKLFVNSKEQIFTEKLKSLLKFQILSSRYKDVLDLYYLINYTMLDKCKLKLYFEKIIFTNTILEINSIIDITNKLEDIFSNERYMYNLSLVQNNWLQVDLIECTQSIVNFIKTLK